jgi:Holliday junction resolvase RusA-like endonuclease
VTRYGAYTPQKTKDYEESVRRAFAAYGLSPFPSDGRYLCAYIRAWFPVPKSCPKKQRKQLVGAMHIKKPDGDNLTKSILDALNKIAYDDDSRVSVSACVKRYTYRDTGSAAVILTDDIREFAEEAAKECEL